MSADTMPIIKLGVPKGSLEDATINLFERAGWKIRKHTRNYFPDINDPQISASLCRVQEIGEYIEAGVLDVGMPPLADGAESCVYLAVGTRACEQDLHQMWDFDD